MGHVKRAPSLNGKDQFKRYAKLSKADIVEAFRDLYRESVGQEFDDERWIDDLERRVKLLKSYRHTWEAPNRKPAYKTDIEECFCVFEVGSDTAVDFTNDTDGQFFTVADARDAILADPNLAPGVYEIVEMYDCDVRETVERKEVEVINA